MFLIAAQTCHDSLYHSDNQRKNISLSLFIKLCLSIPSGQVAGDNVEIEKKLIAHAKLELLQH